MQTPSTIPFLVSWVVLVVASAILKFRNSDIETLLLLPSHREDPAFIMDLEGKIVLSASKTDRLFKKESINAPSYQDDSAYLKNKPLSETEIPIEALIVGLADRYDALRSRRPYKKAFTHERSLAVMTGENRSGISGRERYGNDIWGGVRKTSSKLQKGFRTGAELGLMLRH